ncbi:methyl-CPG-binding domain 4 [Actinidia rufa]|uniref:Methyl-CPG-binding domain 4 n=1 Tax=Actinidia rufa TaxID=165716 RepID=A0A7J0G1N0_9ERIC|nr:methyl-CPG-binding domain 4 [Actinidia rufa]
MRSKFIEEPFFCNKKANVSCEDPADIEYDATRVWVIDKPNLPKTPPGFQRELVLRRDFSKMDAYYITPAGTRVRAPSSVASFLEANPECKGVSVSDFSFTPPKVMDDTVPENVKGPGPSSANKKMKALREEDDDVDAFTDSAFKGNPAAVCLLEEEREDEWMQSVASEFNISQTGYLIRDSSDAATNPRFRLRWFTPVAEGKRKKRKRDVEFSSFFFDLLGSEKVKNPKSALRIAQSFNLEI